MFIRKKDHVMGKCMNFMYVCTYRLRTIHKHLLYILRRYSRTARNTCLGIPSVFYHYLGLGFPCFPSCLPPPYGHTNRTAHHAPRASPRGRISCISRTTHPERQPTRRSRRLRRGDGAHQELETRRQTKSLAPMRPGRQIVRAQGTDSNPCRQPQNQLSFQPHREAPGRTVVVPRGQWRAQSRSHAARNTSSAAEDGFGGEKEQWRGIESVDKCADDSSISRGGRVQFGRS